MKTFFPNNRRIWLVGGAVNLLILAIMIIAITGPSQGTHAQMALTQQDQFSVFCYFYYHDGKDSNADADTTNCSKQSMTFLSILKLEVSTDNYQKWPHQVSLDNLAAAGLLLNPQNEAPIRTQQDFQAAIPTTDQDLLTLFQKDSHLLPTLWDYNSTYDYAPPCSTPATNLTPTPSANACSTSQLDQPPTCPVNPQSFQYPDIWPMVGPAVLSTLSQELQDPNGQHIGIYDIYGRLLIQGHCSFATLAQTLKLNGQPIQANQAYLLEQDALVQIAVTNAPQISSNNQLLLELVWAASQMNKQQLDSWFSAAIITDPINPSTQLPNQLTPSPQPTAGSQSPSSVSVGATLPSSIHNVKILEQNGKDSFQPLIVKVTKGTKVTWTNNSSDTHTITSDNNAFTASSKLGPNQTFSTVFNTVGTFAYHSAEHDYMKGIVIVTS